MISAEYCTLTLSAYLIQVSSMHVGELPTYNF